MELRELNLELNQRLTDLENAVRRWRNIGMAALFSLGAVIVLGAAAYDAAPVFDSVRTQELNVLDASRRVRALVRVGKDDSVALTLLDAEGRTRASLALLPNGDPRLRLYEKLGQPRAGLEIEQNGSGAAVLATSGGTLYFHAVSETIRELPSIEGRRLRKAVTVSEIEAAPEGAYRMVDAERLPPR